MNDAIGFTGYMGGLPQLLKDSSTPKGSYLERAAKKGVFHVGGPNIHGQYSLISFSERILRRAVAGGARRLVFYVTDANQNRHTPSAGLIGDKETVTQYLAHWMPKNIGSGVYFKLFDPYNMDGPQKSKCYIEFDVKRPASDKKQTFATSYAMAEEAIALVNHGLRKNFERQAGSDEKCDLSYVVCSGSRELKDKHEGIIKDSIHVNWLKQGFHSPDDQKNFIGATLGAKGECGQDMKVYGKTQLFRMPWCGKQLDRRAVLLPRKFVYIKGSLVSTVTADEVDAKLLDSFNICPYDASDIIYHSFRSLQNKPNTVSIRQAGTISAPRVQPSLDLHTRKLLTFVKPMIAGHILPLIMKHRSSLLLSVDGGKKSQAGVPTDSLVVTELHYTGFSGVFDISVASDTFCEYDVGGNTPFFHPNNNDATYIQFNFVKGHYRQGCKRCSGQVSKKYSIWGDHGDIEINEYDEYTSPAFLDVAHEEGAKALLYSVGADLMYNPLRDADNFTVYLPSKRIWVSGKASAEQRLVHLANEWTKQYKDYRNAQFHLANPRPPEPTAKDNKARAKILLAIKKQTPLPKTTVSLISKLRGQWSSLFENSAMRMNVYPWLVPLCDGQCYDVRKGTLQPITKEMQFTSTLGCVMKTVNDEECHIIRRWFKEVATGRPDLATFLKRVCALVMTKLKIDRAFYCNMGMGRNGKSVLFEQLQKIFRPAGAMAFRAAKLKENFFSAGANNRSAADAATPSLVDMKHKTLYLVEEASGKALDAALLKKVVSQDTASGRALFGNNQEIEMEGKLVMNANIAPALGDEPALWDRAVFIPWDTRYVPQGENVDEKKWKLPSCNKKKDEIINLNSAFVSVCLWEMHKFLKMEGNMTEDYTITVSEIPLPACVREKTNELRMRANPLMTFAKTHVKERIGSNVRMNQFYMAYKGYLRSMGMPDRSDQVQVMDKLLTIPLLTCEENNAQFVKDITLSEAAILLAEGQTIAQNPLKRGFEIQQQQQQQPFNSKSAKKGDTHAHVKTQYCIMNNCTREHINVDFGDLPLY